MEQITAIGIDVSKGKSVVCAMKPAGECELTPFAVNHSKKELSDLIKTLKQIDGEVRIIMEHTGSYYQPIAKMLLDAGFFVSVIHAKLIHDFGNNTIRKGKTDKKDAIKIANYGLTYWHTLKPLVNADNLRENLKKLNRQLSLYVKIETSLKNNLIAILDLTFPESNKLFPPIQKVNGHEKWVDFVLKFWHIECITSKSLKSFTNSFEIWCKKTGSRFSSEKATQIYRVANEQIASMPKNENTMFIVKQAALQLTSVLETIISIQSEMKKIASQLPEYDEVLSMYGVGEILAARLIAEIGDVTRFDNKRALTAFAGLDAPPYQSGQLDLKQRKISKRGSPYLRHILFLIMSVLMINAPQDNEIYSFMCKKRIEGKHYYVCMTAGSNKFLRQYYGKVNKFLSTEDTLVPKLESATT